MPPSQVKRTPGSRRSTSIIQRQQARYSLASPVKSPALDTPSRRRTAGVGRPVSSSSTNSASSSSSSSDHKESHIQVFVRCRNRSDREVAENSAVVVSTSGGLNGKEVFVQGQNAYTNKQYTFDRAFGPESDQEMVYDSVAANTLVEMLKGYNCTIFAYGQTGTGKTYTMTGDLSPCVSPGRLNDKAGIIPRILHQMFKLLEDESGEYAVKLSYVELYNEDLRDLLGSQSDEDRPKVKIYDDSSKRAVIMQGMEEVFVKSAEEGLRVLRQGADNRQQASTNCNEHSSRSHAVFTITVSVKQVSQDGHESFRTGKLNLVDLAGSENINRSGAENKRAREAGMINQSLLTLGRVINALVERSPHIPYRESKLTRILQDSLGGATKTCIIATVSPAKTSMDETLSTLDYANRAKSIKNQPQVNQTLSKQAHIMDYVKEIERLKADLNATRQKTGVFLTEESYNSLVEESESRRVLAEDRKARIDVVEEQLQKYKSQVEGHSKEMEECKAMIATARQELDAKSKELDDTVELLDHTKHKLDSVTTKLEEEEYISQVYRQSDEFYRSTSKRLISELESTISDVYCLQDKVRRTEHANSVNQDRLHTLKDQVSKGISALEAGESKFTVQFDNLKAELDAQLSDFASSQKALLTTTVDYLSQSDRQVADSHEQLKTTITAAGQSMSSELDGATKIRSEIMLKVNEGLSELKVATERMSGKIIERINQFQGLLQRDQASLNSALSDVFHQFGQQIREHTQTISTLQAKVNQERDASQKKLAEVSQETQAMARQRHEDAMRKQAQLVSKITEMISAFGEEQTQSWDSQSQLTTDSISGVTETICHGYDDISSQLTTVADQMVHMDSNSHDNHATLSALVDRVYQNQLNDQKEIADESHAIHEDMVKVIDDQETNVSQKLDVVDKFISKAQDLNNQETDKQLAEVEKLKHSSQEHYSSVIDRVSKVHDQTTEWSTGHGASQRVLYGEVGQYCEDQKAEALKLQEHGNDIEILENKPAGCTPTKTRTYYSPEELPHPVGRDELLKQFRASGKGAPRPPLATMNINSV
uniref:Kinesin-like protein KIP1 n=1 Tax=Blastobotrys adeninivorans TaxID=409370 RepID=A0A060TGD8_BLAAD